MSILPSKISFSLPCNECAQLGKKTYLKVTVEKDFMKCQDRCNGSPLCQGFVLRDNRCYFLRNTGCRSTRFTTVTTTTGMGGMGTTAPPTTTTKGTATHHVPRLHTYILILTILCFVLLCLALPAYSKLGLGVAGQQELWLGGHNQGVASCFKRVMADARCAKDFFTYVPRGDGNCGCKASHGALKIRGDNNADYYRVNQKGNSE